MPTGRCVSGSGYCVHVRPSNAYSSSLQQFVKGTGSFVAEMADAILNGLTSGRHGNFMETVRKEEEERQQWKQKEQKEEDEEEEEEEEKDRSLGVQDASSVDQVEGEEEEKVCRCAAGLTVCVCGNREAFNSCGCGYVW